MKLILLTTLILSVCHISKANEALVIGGFGATTFLQVVTKDGVCKGEVGLWQFFTITVFSQLIPADTILFREPKGRVF